ncbi:hypothetical protein [Sanguibacter suaedae]|uniref:Preprotein translocase subunit SecD n=1 Tax=Sanguibacter suaedae TaxID=2795737 RepID=A0A934MBR9_9MICO|nr:hypothetical protein [Sanguibacter suaedae]MBI9115601.1 hypothetical protein [Sanguibacter suaedae]
MKNSRRTTLLVIVAAALGGCAAEEEPDQTPGAPSGTVGLAVSVTCDEGSDPLCVPIGDQHVMSPAGYQAVPVDDAAVAERDGQNSVALTFTEDGADALTALTEEAAEAGDSARLVMRVGDEIRSAVEVPGPVDGNTLTIALPPDESAQEVVDLIVED